MLPVIPHLPQSDQGTGNTPTSGWTRLVTEVTRASRSGGAARSWRKARRAESMDNEKGKASAFGSGQSVPERAASSHPAAPTGCRGRGRGGGHSLTFTTLRTGCNLIAFPDGVRSESQSGKYDRKDSHVWPISISWLVTVFSLHFMDTCF